MKKLVLKRVSNTENGTFGVMLDNGRPFCVSLELPWRDNQKNVSCIPEGNYIVRQLDSDEAFDFVDVPGRSGIQIEVANRISELKGCIAVGEKFESITAGSYDIQESRKAFNELKSKVGDMPFMLLIFPAKRDEYIVF